MVFVLYVFKADAVVVGGADRCLVVLEDGDGVGHVISEVDRNVTDLEYRLCGCT